MKIGVTIVGCGAVVEVLYRRPLRKLEKLGVLEVVALVDSYPDHAIKLQEFFPKASIFKNVESATTKYGSNLTIVTSPPASHAEHSIKALQKLNHVLCEKPMALTEDQCMQMIKTAHKVKRLLAVGMPRRFYPTLNYLKNLVSQRKLGDHLSFHYREGRQYHWPVTTSANFRRDKGGGGVLFDTGSHVLDSLIWIFGIPSKISYFDDAMKGGVEANCVIQIKAPNFRGSIHLSWDENMANELRVVGTNGEVIVKLDKIEKLAIKKSDIYQVVTPNIFFSADFSKQKPKLRIPKSYPECVFLQIVQIIRSIQFGEHIPATGEDGKEVISLIEKCYDIAKPIDFNWLPSYQNESYKNLHWRIHR